MSTYLAKLESYPELEGSIIRATKIHKVLKAMIRLPSIPQDAEYGFKKRSVDLLSKWNKVLADDPAGAGDKDDDDKKDDDKKADDKADEKPETNGVKADEPEAAPAVDAEKLAAAAAAAEDGPAEEAEAEKPADEKLAEPSAEAGKSKTEAPAPVAETVQASA